MATHRKIDRRVKYTKAAIRESFLSLLAEKPLDKISVTEICKRADINRGTFYSHYSDPVDLRESLEQELVDTLSECRKSCLENGDRVVPTVKTLEVMKENKELCMVFAGPNGDIDAMMKLIEGQSIWYMDELISAADHLSESSKTCLRLMLTASISSVLKFWFDGGMEQPPEVIAGAMETYCMSGISGFVKHA